MSKISLEKDQGDIQNQFQKEYQIKRKTGVKADEDFR